MKKVLLFASALAFASAVTAQSKVLNSLPAMDRSLYKATGSPYDQDLNDSVNDLYTVANLNIKQVEAVSIVDSAAMVLKKFYAPGQFVAKATTDNQWEVAFTHPGGDNYNDMNLLWTSWGVKASKDGYNQDGTYAFSKKIVDGKIVDVPVAEQDTLNGYLVNLLETPQVTMTVKSTKKTNIRVDLIDKNRRVANTLAPHHWINTPDTYVDLTFKWDVTKLDGTPDWKTENPDTDEFDIATAADGWAGAWWGTDAGRNTPEGKTPSGVLMGRNAWKGAIMLDLTAIAGIAIHVEDGSINKDYSLDKTKTLTFKKIVVGKSDAPVHLNKTELTTIFNATDAVEKSSDLSLTVKPTVGKAFNVSEESSLVSLASGAVLAVSVNGVIDATGIAAGVYSVKATKTGRVVKVVVE